jgi:hypothetical protein
MGLGGPFVTEPNFEGGTPGGGAVDSVNGKAGVVVLDAEDVGAAPSTHSHTSAQITDGVWGGGAADNGKVVKYGVEGSLGTEGEFSSIFTSGSDAALYTEGVRAEIFTQGANAHIRTDGGGHIQTTSTFKISGPGGVATISSPHTANREIALPDESGTAALTNDPRFSDARTPTAHTHVATNIRIPEGGQGLIGYIGDPVGIEVGSQVNGATATRTWLNVADGANNYVHPNHSGDVTSSGDGATTIAATAISGKTELTTPAGTEQALVNDAGTLKRVTLQKIADIKPSVEYLTIAISDETTDLTTGTAKVTLHRPFAYELVSVYASLSTVATGSTVIFDINNGANSALSTKLSIDASEETSGTAASAAVIDATYKDFAANAKLTIDIDQRGSTNPGKGAKVTIGYRRT